MDVSANIQSTAYDASGVSTNPLRREWQVTFVAPTGAVNAITAEAAGAAPTTEVQELYVYARENTINAGTFKLSFEGSTISSCLSYTASASDIKTALDALTDVTVIVGTATTLNAGAPGVGKKWAITFTGNKVLRNVAQLVPTDIGSGACAAFTAASGAISDHVVSVKTIREGVDTREVVLLQSGSSKGGNNPAAAHYGMYKASFGGQTTGCIQSNATAATLEQELEGLSTIDDVTVSRDLHTASTHSTYTFSITFSGPSLAGDVDALTVDTSTCGMDAGLIGQVSQKEERRERERERKEETTARQQLT